MDFPGSRQRLPNKCAAAILITLTLLLFPVFAPDCGAREWKSGQGKNQETMLTLTSTDSGKSLALRVGNTFTVSLEENPTTGFQWAVDSTGDGLVQLQASKYIPSPGSGVGRGGQKILTFKAQRTGTGQLKLKLWRKWEGDSSIAERFTLTLQVGD